MKKLFGFVFLVLLIVSCKKEDTPATTYPIAIPKGFPKPVIPPDNYPTEDRVEFGRRLFMDPVLSKDSSIACVSCHKLDIKFTDGLPVSIGIEGRHGIRNAPTILNSAYLNTTLWDGGVPNLEQQVLAPIENPNEMDFNLPDIVARLNQIASYRELSMKAYGQLPSIYSITRAIACFERTLYTGISKYDRYTYYNEPNALNESEKRGMTLFFNERGDC
ncbi:MAG TPA: cytochrome-c peroxidase, partial [Chitinophagaceae bacterium]|nr:cytochrome-c peroxidase [Chitinophagaceae bacterium]